MIDKLPCDEMAGCPEQNAVARRFRNGSARVVQDADSRDHVSLPATSVEEQVGGREILQSRACWRWAAFFYMVIAFIPCWPVRGGRFIFSAAYVNPNAYRYPELIIPHVAVSIGLAFLVLRSLRSERSTAGIRPTAADARVYVAEFACIVLWQIVLLPPPAGFGPSAVLNTVPLVTYPIFAICLVLAGRALFSPDCHHRRCALTIIVATVVSYAGFWYRVVNSLIAAV
jgi:hypothetical protein